MTEMDQFPALEKFRAALQSRSALLDTPVDEKLLSELRPTPLDAFQRALDNDGATEPDVNAFLESLKALKFGNESLLTRDGLVSLANVVWQLTFAVRPQLQFWCFV